MLTLSPLLTAKMSYANNLNPDEIPSNISFGSKLFDTRTTFLPNLSNNEALWRLKQTRNLADNNLFSELWICRMRMLCSMKCSLWRKIFALTTDVHNTCKALKRHMCCSEHYLHISHSAPNCIKDFLDLPGYSGQLGFTLQLFPMVILAYQVWRYNCFHWKQLWRETWLARITPSANEKALYNLVQMLLTKVQALFRRALQNARRLTGIFSFCSSINRGFQDDVTYMVCCNIRWMVCWVWRNSALHTSRSKYMKSCKIHYIHANYIKRHIRRRE